MEATTYSSQQTPAQQQPKRRLVGSGAMWGFLFGLFGGSASAVALAMTYAVATWIDADADAFSDGMLLFFVVGMFGAMVGGFIGAMVGLVAGFFLGLARIEWAARWVTAAICAALPLVVVAEIWGTVPRDQGDLVQALVVAVMFSTIGYFTGAGFEGRLAEDARWRL